MKLRRDSANGYGRYLCETDGSGKERLLKCDVLEQVQRERKAGSDLCGKMPKVRNLGSSYLGGSLVTSTVYILVYLSGVG